MPHCGYADLTRFEDSVDINWRTGGPGGPVGDDFFCVQVHLLHACESHTFLTQIILGPCT